MNALHGACPWRLCLQGAARQQTIAINEGRCGRAADFNAATAAQDDDGKG